MQTMTATPAVPAHLRCRTAGFTKPTSSTVAWVDCPDCRKLAGNSEGPTLSYDGATP
jgi:hypothetical protein